MTRDEAVSIALAALRAAPGQRMPVAGIVKLLDKMPVKRARAIVKSMTGDRQITIWGKNSAWSWAGLPGAVSPDVDLTQKLFDGIKSANRPVSLHEVLKMLAVGAPKARALMAPLIADGSIVERKWVAGGKEMAEYGTPGLDIPRAQVNRMKFGAKTALAEIERPKYVKIGPQETRLRTVWKRIEQGENVDQIDLVTAVADAQWLANCVDVHASARRLAVMVEAEAKGKLGWR